MELLAPGKRFGKYRILRHIGRGGMGVVYLAEDSDLGRRIALKVLDRDVTSSEDFEDRFRQEARVIAALDHPNIVIIHTLERVGDEIAIDMAYVDGGSLEDAEHGSGLTVYAALSHAHDVLKALACCHEAGIVHRDVKPSNILMAADGRALLSDFGLAKLLATHQTSSILTKSTTSLFIGTPQYAPPESWDGHEPAPTWDVYSTGVVLYEAIATRMPYDAETPYALIKQMIERPIPPLHEMAENVSPELSGLVANMMDRDPTMRPPDASEALARLALVPELTTDVGRQSARTRFLKPKPRRRAAPRNPRLFTPARLKGWGAVAVSVFVLIVAWTSGTYWFERVTNTPDTRRAIQPTPEPAASSYAVFDTVDTATQEVRPNHWLMRPGTEPATWDVVAFESTRLWCLRGRSEEDGVLRLEGGWAEYADDTARVFRHGTVSGTARWLGASEDSSATLEFRSAQDGSRRSRVFLLRHRADSESDVSFLRRLEAAEHIQPIIYRELLPRKLAWAEHLEGLCASVLSPRVTVPRLSADAGGIDINGRLDEADWHLVHLSHDQPPGRLPAQAGETDGDLLLRYDERGLYIGLRVREALAAPNATIVLLNRHSVPLSHSPRWSVQIENGAIVASHHTAHGKSEAWTCAWQTAHAMLDDEWQAEVFVPFDNLNGAPPAQPGDRWRMNCAVSDTQSSKPSALIAVARWGYEEVPRAEHGAVLVFGAADAFGNIP
ncbi:MAG: protein kinase [Nitrospiraceae bacterium]|nr:protein kinase [Nitrospiraceae bacterium]